MVSFIFYKEFRYNKGKSKMLFTMAKLKFATTRLMPKRNVIGEHAKKVRNERMLKAIGILEKKKQYVEGKYVSEVIKMVEQLQSDTFMAPLNPSPEYNSKFGLKRKNRSIRKFKIPNEFKVNLPQAWVYSFSKNLPKKEIISLDKDVFAKELRRDILHRVVVYQMARKRQGTACQKNRSEVRGGGRKPWTQKGTGRARHGSIRSPLFRGGGRVFPKKPRDFSINLQKKVRKLGLKIALSQKLRENNIKIIDQIPKNASTASDILNRNNLKEVLLVDTKQNIDDNLEFREDLLTNFDLPRLHLIGSHRVNVYALLRIECLMITLPALKELVERISKFEEMKRINREADENLQKMRLIKDANFNK